MRVEWVASTLHSTSEHGVSSITTVDAHTSAACIRLNRRRTADSNRPDRFAERLNLASAHVPSHFKRPLPQYKRSSFSFMSHRFWFVNVELHVDPAVWRSAVGRRDVTNRRRQQRFSFFRRGWGEMWLMSMTIRSS